MTNIPSVSQLIPTKRIIHYENLKPTSVSENPTYISSHTNKTHAHAAK